MSINPNDYKLNDCQEIKLNLDESIQDQMDDFISCASVILNNAVNPPEEFTASTLRMALAIMHRCKLSLRELDYYRQKFTPVKPDDLEMSAIKKCYIGKCKCGQLLIQSKDRCCPRCNQFVDWPDSPVCCR